MKILYINDNDIIGRRFNGYDLQLALNKSGNKAKQLVICKASEDSNVSRIINHEIGGRVRDKCREFERELSLQSVVYPFEEVIKNSEEFQNADIVHYHLIFNQFLSIYSFCNLAKLKPTVWTIHDPWALTGHCVHPVDCKKWLTGCNDCQSLDRYSPLKEDNAQSIWNIKKDVYKNMDIDIVVASKWMYDMVKRSPLTSHFKKVHLIPFGIDTEIFRRRKNREEIRRKLGIKKDSFVMMFRQSSQEWKGLKYLKDMLKLLKNNNVTLLTIDETGLLDDFKNKYKIIEYKWIEDENMLVDLYSAADIFLMPSIAEAFGLMAIEAMSCSLPVVVFDNTALPSVTFAPKCGISLKKGDNREFLNTINRLIISKEEVEKRGRLGRKIAERVYNVENHNREMIKLYESILRK